LAFRNVLRRSNSSYSRYLFSSATSFHLDV
jgi:hypothetical protein